MELLNLNRSNGFIWDSNFIEAEIYWHEYIILSPKQIEGCQVSRGWNWVWRGFYWHRWWFGESLGLLSTIDLLKLNISHAKSSWFDEDSYLGIEGTLDDISGFDIFNSANSSDAKMNDWLLLLIYDFCKMVDL